jgi:hypothetical protein
MSKAKTVSKKEQRLLAAAPSMLAALRACRGWVVQDVEHYEDGGGEEWAGSVKLLKQITQAITKAEGSAT